MEKQTNENIIKPSEKRPQRNLWKIATLVLLGLFAGVVIFFTVNLLSSPKEIATDEETSMPAGTDLADITMTKEQANTLISHFLTAYQGKNKTKYQLVLSKQAMLSGTLQILGQSIDFHLSFDPYVMENGNLQLKARTLALGTLQLPISQALRFIGTQFDFPEWITIDQSEKAIILHFDKFEAAKGVYLKAKRINLADDELRFSVYLKKAANK